MLNKKNIILKSLSILEKKVVTIFFLFIAASIFISFIELIGISFLGTFIMFLSDINGFLDKIDKFEILSFMHNFNEKDLIYFFLISISVFFVIKNLIVFVFFYFFHKFKAYFTLIISKKIFSKNMKNNYEYFLAQKKSKIIHDIREESLRFIGVLFSILNIVKETFLIFFLGLSIFIVNWKISSIVLFTFILFSLIIFAIVKEKLYSLGKDLTFFQSNFLKKLFEAFNNIKFIKIRKIENFITTKLFYFQKRAMDTTFTQNVIVTIPRLVLEVLAVGGLCLTIYIYINSSLPIDKLIPILSFIALAIIRIMPAISSININVNNITTHIHSLEIVNSYIKQKDLNLITRDENLKDSNYKKIEKIKFENVCFKYKVDNPSFGLDKINLTIEKNDIIGVIGRSGSGKTTFADLLLGLLKPDNGKILINDKKSENIDNQNLNFSYIPQSINLLDDNLYENIAFGNRNQNIDKDKMKKILSKADLDTLDKDLYLKNIGEDGIKISGGQKQRIGIARALYNEPNLLILDEPTSELDYTSEKKIMQNISELKIDIIIIIAHRINSLNICNKLLILDNGKILDFGTKKEVLSKHIYLEKFFEDKN
jgi:ATP-binding cassette, subfamily B, bacterial PglK|tara:strand:+ start:4777 stop:6567 length:1791 start_codon:yes stop_codon:yes gene_type:complete